MKPGIHPEVFDIDVQCTCGNSFKTVSTRNEINVTLCSKCHPYYTGAQRFVDTAGRIEKFEKRFQKAHKKA